MFPLEIINFVSMVTKRVIADKDFKQIIIRTHRGMKNMTMRVKANGLYVTVPPFSRTDEVLRVLEQYRSPLLEKYKKVAKKSFDMNYTIDVQSFKLRLAPGPFTFFSVKFEDEKVIIYCPKNVDFSNDDVQRLVRNAIIRAMRRRAEEYLSPLLKVLAEENHFTYKKVRIKATKSRWGSCSAAGSINLSCYLLLLPPHLIDYVLLHELCHTKEMNHGPKFWELLNSVTGGLAFQLRKELRDLKVDF